MELFHFFCGVLDARQGFPRVLLLAIPLPLDEVLERLVATMQSRVNDSFNFVLFFAFDVVRW